MTQLRKLAWVLFWVLLSINFSVSKAQVLDPTQAYTTGNVVLPTITGTYTTPWVNGVYQDELTCWGWGDPGYCGPNAIVRPGNNINFSFGTTDLYQIQPISSLLPDSGTGLRIDGFNFGFMAKNGNGWDNGQLDYLTAYVNFYDKNNATIKNFNYDLNSVFNWTSFNYSETFSSPIGTNQLSSVRYGFIGRDNNFWAGPYGPEITNVSFSLKYSVDPCFVNVLSSPSCPGYLEALAKLTPPQLTAPAQPIELATAPITYEIQPAALSQPPVQQNFSQQQAPLSTQQQTTNTSAPSLGTILGIIRNEQARLSTVESSAVQQSNETALQLSSQAQTTAESVATTAAQQSFEQQNIQQTPAGSGITLTSQSSNAGFNISNQTTPTVNESFALVGPSPLKDYIDSATQDQSTTQPQQEQRQAEVKKNVKDNEMAGGVTIASIATQPIGFELYQQGLKDAPFYQPKEIYKNQKVVDNERVLRQLNRRSDRVFEDMVNEQYK